MKRSLVSKTNSSPAGQLPEQTLQSEIRFLRSLPMFAEVDELELARLCQVLARQSYPQGAVLLAEGQINDALYLIREGAVGLFHPATAEQPYLQLERGRFFGQVSMFDPAPASATVRALTPVDVLCLRTRPLGDLFVMYPTVATRLLMAIIQDLARRHRALLQKFETSLPVAFDCDRHHP
jgi:CRP/FNR family transcriptional regulator